MLKKLKRLYNRIRWKEVLLVLMAIALVCLLCMPFVSGFFQKMEARSILSEAKNVQLTMELLAMDSYGTKTTMRDDTRDSGLTKAAEQEIVSLPEVTGSIQVMGWEKNGLIPDAFLYVNGDYAVIYREIGSNEPTWQVYRSKKLLDL